MPSLIYPQNNYTSGPIDYASLYSKVKGFQNPGIPNREAVSNIDVNKYPYPYVIGSDNDELRAETQSIWSQWGNAAVRTGSQLVLGTLKGLTDIPDLFKAFLGPDGLAALADEDFGNDLSKALGSAMEGIKNATPIYLEKDERGFNPGKAAWWASNMDSIATGVSMLLPTIGAAKGAEWVSKLLGAAARSAGLGALVQGEKATALASSMFGALYGNAYESMQEMQQTLPQLKQQMQEAGYSEDKIKKVLKEEGAKMYWGNLPNAALDMLGIYQLTKPMSGIDNIIETNVKKRLAHTAAMEVIPEGLQEMRNQYVSQRTKANVDKMLGLRSDDYTMSEFWKDPNTWTSGFFGALGGLALD